MVVPLKYIAGLRLDQLPYCVSSDALDGGTNAVTGRLDGAAAQHHQARVAFGSKYATRASAMVTHCRLCAMIR